MTLTVAFDKGVAGQEALQRIQAQFGAASDIKMNKSSAELSAVWKDTRRDLVNHLVSLVEDDASVQQIAIINE